jgi:putative copper resistance protein D
LIRFSRLGYVAVCLLIGTGCINTLAIAPDARRIIDTDYGRILAIKLALVVMMVGLAVVNRLVLLPKMGPGNSAAKRASGAFL